MTACVSSLSVAQCEVLIPKVVENELLQKMKVSGSNTALNILAGSGSDSDGRTQRWRVSNPRNFVKCLN